MDLSSFNVHTHKQAKPREHLYYRWVFTGQTVCTCAVRVISPIYTPQKAGLDKYIQGRALKISETFSYTLNKLLFCCSPSEHHRTKINALHSPNGVGYSWHFKVMLVIAQRYCNSPSIELHRSEKETVYTVNWKLLRLVCVHCKHTTACTCMHIQPETPDTMICAFTLQPLQFYLV